MFFFASDNALAPLLVSQLKAIKEAGFHQNAEVLVYFDPNEAGVVSHIFNVNAKRKQQATGNVGAQTMIGDGSDPYLCDLGEDDIAPGSIDQTAGPYSRKTKKMLSRPDQVSSRHALENFLGFCRENHAARHYLLFLVGHGMIVANDKFLPDDNPPSSISLRQLGEILSGFCEDARASGGELEILTLNSCSMSSIEVAYQLRDTANLMLASQGITFVGNWPYRQLLKEFFRMMNFASPNRAKANGALVKELAERFYFLCLCNATDFVLSGESFDLCLTQLGEDFFAKIREHLPRLVREMKAGLSAPNNQRIMELIQLAHLKSQSFYQEDYSDLLDFCKCLAEICNSSDSRQRAIGRECSKVVEALSPDPANRFAKLIVRADHFGWKYQYANGLSIYFPWVEPIGAQDAHLSKYRTYDFNGQEFSTDSWATFLRVYFAKTKRLPEKNGGLLLLDNSETIRNLGSASTAANNLALTVTNGALDKPTGAYDKPTGASGQDCGCPSIKNYPTTVGRFNGKRRRVRTFSVTKGLAEDRPHFLQE